MSTISAARDLCGRLITRLDFGSAVTWFRWLVIFTGVAVAATSCKMMN